MAARDDWQGELGRRWAEGAARQDALLDGLEQPGIAALGPLEGRRVLDLGCGPGASVLGLAAAGARVTGLDVSPDLAALARERVAEAGVDAEIVVADGAAPPFAEGAFDALFSRFGAMFFDDPVAAWTALRRVVAPGGPMAVVAWTTPRANLWASLPVRVLRDLIPEEPAPSPGAPGPFGWADPAVFAPWLEAAGWRGVAWREEARSFDMGPDPAAAARRMAEAGPASRRVAQIAPERQGEATDRLAAALAEHVADGRVMVPAEIRIVTATA